MTRFARAGPYQKKQPHSATRWQDFKSHDQSEASSSNGINKRKYNDDRYSQEQMRFHRSEFRRHKRIDKRESAKVCFNCRKEGHMVANCPDKKGQGMGICFKCGSTEHGVNECRSKVKSGEYPYATCFICHEKGHLTKQCPDNPRGLYPNGGCCKECESVEHFRRDCPELQKHQGFVDVTAQKLTNVTSADAEIVENSEVPQPKIKRKGPKIVKF